MESDSLKPQLCVRCSSRLRSSKPACRQCGYIIRAEKNALEMGLPCPACRDQKFAFDEVESLGIYEGALADAVLKMKYDGGQPLAYAIGDLLAKCSERAANPGYYDFAACASKHWTKRLVTGINSPEVIMQGAAERANLPNFPDLLVCRRRIQKQSMLSPRQRQQNVRQAWHVSAKYDIRGARVLLVDDILTTGATVDAMSRELKQSGATFVGVMVAGRAIK